MSKVVEYVGLFHTLKDRLRERWTQYWYAGNDEEEKETNFRAKVKDKLEKLKQRTISRINHSSTAEEDYGHLTRPKTRMELVRISAAVMGIEFSYAAETAFVSPLLLNIGLKHSHMTLMWCLSPLLGFFITPLFGSLSDGCRSRLGRRRPFIILLSIGIVLGLILVPNGKSIGLLLGDTYRDTRVIAAKTTEIPPVLVTGTTTTTMSPTTEPPALQAKSLMLDSSFLLEQDESKTHNPIENRPVINEPTDPVSYKRTPHHSALDDSGKQINYMERQTDHADEVDVLKKLKLSHKTEKHDGDSLDSLFQQTMDEMETNSSHEDEGPIMTNKRTEFLAKKQELDMNNQSNFTSLKAESQTKGEVVKGKDYTVDSISNHPWGLVFTVIGTVLLDFDADACQSPSRAYMLDVTIPEDHARGLSTFTIMAGLGGSLGYFLGALNWEGTFIGNLFGGQVRAVFTLVLFIFIACVITTIRSFEEIPIDRLYAGEHKPADRVERGEYSRFEEEEGSYPDGNKAAGYGATSNVEETSFNQNLENQESNSKPQQDSGAPAEISAVILESEKAPTFREYVKTIVQMPRSLQWLCVTNYFCWMSLVCYSLYFTDFVGEAVYGGDPAAPLGSETRTLYEQGVRFGCWGMSLYSLSCSIYSLAIDALVQRFGARRVYICGQLIYSVGMVLMGSFRAKIGVIIFSWTAGIMYATLFTMPYLLVARYHAADTFELDVDELVAKKPSLKRGLGTDVAIVSSMVFLAQITQAITLGTVVTAAGSPAAIVFAAALFAFCGAIAATKVLYLDL